MLTRFPLRYTIPLIIFVVGSVVVSVVFRTELRRSYANVEENAREHVLLLGTILSADLEASFRNQENDMLRRDFERVVGDRNLKFAALIDESDKVLVSTSYGLKEDEALPRLLLQNELFRTARQKMSSALRFEDDGTRLVSAFPVLLSARQGELLPTRVGLLVMDHDLSLAKAQARSEAITSATLESVVLAALCALLSIFLYLRLFRRMQRLVTATEGLARGDFSVPIRLRGRDELTRLSQALDQMAQKLRQHTEALRKNEEHFRTLIERASDVITIINGDGFMLFQSPSVERTLGYTPDEMIGKNILEFLHTDDHVPVLDTIRRAFEHLGEPQTVEYRIRHKDGSWRIFESIGQTLAEESHALRVVVNSRDITERKETEEELSRLAMAVEQSQELIVIVDVKGRIQYVNPAFARLTGQSQDSFVDVDVHEFASSIYDDDYFERIEPLLARGEVVTSKVKARKPDGSDFYAEATITPLRDVTGKLVNYVSVLRDVTHEAELEARLRRAQKLEAIGTLAGGIAHDFNNSLSAILGFSELVRFQLEDGSTEQRNIDQAMFAAAHAKDLVQQILTFSRQVDTEPNPIHMHLVVKECLKLLHATIPSTIEIVEHIDSGTGTVFADPTQIHQVVMNLCTNAYHAMETGGGTLEIGLESIVADDDLSGMHPALEVGREYLKLSVRDTGYGMDAHTLERIFDPFFTTKGQGKGTGLGLATVHGIVSALEGDIGVSTEPGAGSTFDIYLPCYEAQDQVQPRDEQSVPVGKGEHILLVDDERFILDCGNQLLKILGYEVTTARNGAEALEMLNTAAKDVDLVVTDQVMPGMTGTELAEALNVSGRDIPVILITGFSHSSLPSTEELPNLVKIVFKPFTRAELGAAVREALEARSKA